MLAVTMMPLRARLVWQESTNLWVDKEAASHAFLESTTIKRIKQSAKIVLLVSIAVAKRSMAEMISQNALFVKEDFTKIKLDKHRASPVFLPSTTIKRIKQSASLAAETSTLTSQRKHHAIVAVSAKSLIQAVPDAPSVTVEKLVLDKTARASHAKQDSTEAHPWNQNLAPYVQLVGHLKKEAPSASNVRAVSSKQRKEQARVTLAQEDGCNKKKERARVSRQRTAQLFLAERPPSS